MKVSKFMKLLSLENWSNICANLQNRKTVLLLHLSNSGDLLLWVGVCRAFTSSSQALQGQS